MQVEIPLSLRWEPRPWYVNLARALEDSKRAGPWLKAELEGLRPQCGWAGHTHSHRWGL